ncbi:hypothetical protein [Methylonatrum kenyense]|uniref:hypothetical protein n=1 Tax=Methylonatrum kenyense TaxID=455253 RepID=UPI003D0E63E5
MAGSTCASDLPGQGMHLFQRIRIPRRQVLPPAGNPGEAQGDAGLVPAGRRNALEGAFEHLYRFHSAHRSETLGGVPPDPAVQLLDLLIPLGEIDAAATAGVIAVGARRGPPGIDMEIAGSGGVLATAEGSATTPDEDLATSIELSSGFAGME